MNKNDFYYDLPKEYIAQTPSPERDESKLMIINRKTDAISHSKFKDILNYINPDDVLVLNNTKVIPARLHMIKKNTGGIVEILLINKICDDIWTAMVSPGRRIKSGSLLVHETDLLSCEIIEKKPNGDCSIKFNWDRSTSFKEILDKIGKTPLPPYIKSDPDKFKDNYQTIYAKIDGSIAAPTAGLHFTDILIERIMQKGTKIVYITLHVGPGTFKPVKKDNIEDHIMDSEYFTISEESANIVNKVRNNGGRCIAVGTTVTRTLEFSSSDDGILLPASGWTNLFIKPGYKFKTVDSLITNFHLPESTLIMLVSAFYNRQKVINAYKNAIENNYRFYSFGDAMYIF